MCVCVCVLHVSGAAGSRPVLTLVWLKDGLLCSAGPQGPGPVRSSTPGEGGETREGEGGLAVEALPLSPGGGEGRGGGRGVSDER